MTPREPPAWERVDPPARNTLYGVTVFGSGAVAVGESGVVFGRPNGESWQTVIDHGPGGNSRTLSAVDATDDGARVWFAGDSGAVGTYDVAGAVKRDFSGVADIDADWQAVAVTGDANEETVFLATDEGAVLRLSIVDRSLQAGELSRPPTLSSGLAGIETLDDGRLAVLSRAGRLYVTADREQWTTAQFQPDEFVDAGAAGDAVYAARADGLTIRHDDDGAVAFPLGQPTITAVDAAVRTAAGEDAPAPERVVAVGSDGGVYRRARDGWVTVTTEEERTLQDVSIVPSGADDDARDVAVGAAGTILERGGVPEGSVDWTEPPSQRDDGGASIY